jgi:4-hydroxy-tetrahydrodipicolinate synthase
MIYKKLTGVVPPVGTPLTAGDRVDVPGLRRLTRHLIDGGVHALFANGSMGGFAFLTDAEQMRCIETVVDEAGGKLPVMAGLGETSTSRAVLRAKEIQRTGASYLSLLPPFYFFAQQKHLIAYFSEVAAAVDLPVLLYDNPVATKNPIYPETVAELRSKIPHLVGVKESNQDCVNLQRLLSLTRDDPNFSVLTGSEFLILIGLQMGVQGCVGGLHNICPRIAVELYDAFQRGDLATARERQLALTDLWQIFTCGNVWGAFDEALRYLGICDRATGAPYITALTETEREKVHALIDRHVGAPVSS